MVANRDRLLHLTAQGIQAREDGKLCGRNLPNGGRELQGAKQFRFHYTDSEGIVRGNRKVYVVKIEANIPPKPKGDDGRGFRFSTPESIGTRRFEIFGPVGENVDWNNAVYEADVHWPKITGAAWLGMVKQILRDKISLYITGHHSGILEPPECCSESDALRGIRRRIVEPAGLAPSVPHIKHMFEAGVLLGATKTEPLA